jgi:hypothetical protein
MAVQSRKASSSIRTLGTFRESEEGQHRSPSDVVASLDHHPGLCRHYLQRPQRQGLPSRFRDRDMVGHKLGEFAPTRFFKAHGAHTAKAV